MLPSVCVSTSRGLSLLLFYTAWLFGSPNRLIFLMAPVMNTAFSLANYIVRSPQWRAVVLIQLLIAFVVFVPRTRAATPPTDGGYPGGNTAEGQDALLSLTTGTYNTAVGFLSLRNVTRNNFNTAVGAGALLADNGDPTTGGGSQNTATGAGALLSNTTGAGNAANGAFALFNNTDGGVNTANGAFALFNNTSGNQNTANGVNALLSNSTGIQNTANGYQALSSNTTGDKNTAIGINALFSNTTGTGNIALGFGAGTSVITANNVICIAANGADVDNSCFIGNIVGVTTQGTAIPVVIDDFGQLGTMSSSARFKKDIKSMDKVSESVLALKPVTFQYKSDKNATPQFGLVAEDVAKVNPDLVVRDNKGEIYTVRYEAVNAMLLNEFLKEHHKVQELEANAARQQKQIEALTTGLQKVRGDIEASKSTTRLVLTDQ
jgi:hypothetical protein